MKLSYHIFADRLKKAMNLEKIVSITGKAGLYQIIAETPKRIIVEALDGSKKKIPVSSNFKIALLDKITIFTKDGSDLFLKEIFESMLANEETTPVPETSASPADQRTYFKTVAPLHDESKVYSSDLKKIIRWFHLLKSTGHVK